MNNSLLQMRSRAQAWSDEPRVRIPHVMRPHQLSLAALLGWVSFAAVCCALATQFGWILGALIFFMAVALRTAIVDFTWRGDLATLLVLVSGGGCIVRLVLLAVWLS